FVILRHLGEPGLPPCEQQPGQRGYRFGFPDRLDDDRAHPAAGAPTLLLVVLAQRGVHGQPRASASSCPRQPHFGSKLSQVPTGRNLVPFASSSISLSRASSGVSKRPSSSLNAPR